MELTRDVPPALMTAISGGYFHPVVLAYIDWPGAPLRAHSGRGNISWDGQTWLGVGKFGSVDVPEEAAAGIPTEFTMMLVTDFPDLEAYTDTAIKGADASIYMGEVSERGGNSLIGAVEVSTGTADGLGMTVEVTDENGQPVTMFGLRVTVTTGPSYRSMAAIAHSHEDQSRQYPADTAGRHLMFAQSLAEKTYWPEP
ncbi:hypothetical protein SAMN04489859_103561 [Paracoccus alcaliphilus]|uniref:Uncharacterized protein n=1 Tax=Paracoccus alcaliphilus TaxID=34002 RepID=A0A1H8M2V6_9RHOB|nr:hypothetical protein [Paracoccus alcaliphilus]WCR18451.1 hypothetical protein JHW40_01400 [Paracoccus alcaliphilus]SEO11610.1 hypothetical protein SAMN04489859_103561 [Paracoccus alcaliphilus]